MDWREPRCTDSLAWQLGLDISHFQLTAMNCRTALMLPEIWNIFNIPERPVQFLERGKKRFLKEDYHTKSEMTPGMSSVLCLFPLFGMQESGGFARVRQVFCTRPFIN